VGAAAHGLIRPSIATNCPLTGRLASSGRRSCLPGLIRNQWFRICWSKRRSIWSSLILTGHPVRRAAVSRTPAVVVAFEYADTKRLCSFASAHEGRSSKKWQLFGAAALFSEAAE
jgi:hypothetical protein